MCICSFAATLTEDFEKGLPSSAPDVPTEVTLSSGNWTVKGCYGDKNNGSMRCRMNTNAYIVTPSLDQPGSITVSHRGSGNNKVLVVEKSTDGGKTWSEVGRASVSSSSNFGTSSFSASSKASDTEVLIRFTCLSASIFIDDISISLKAGDNGGGDDDDPTPDNPEPQDTIEWTGPHSVEHCLYVAPWSKGDSGDGSWEKPFYNLQVAINQAQPGDTIYVRGGTYYPTYQQDGSKTTIRIEKNGSPDAWFTIKTFPGEFPVLNFKSQPKRQSIRGMIITGNYWHLYGLHITQAGDNGIKLEGSHNIIERCTFSYNDDTGLQLGFGHDFSASGHGSSNDGSWCAYNDIVDCDSYLNYDSDNRGSDADGFACKMHNGKGNRFIRCRAWHNSDDAWDLYETDYSVKLIECWAWCSGIASDFSWAENASGGSFQGNGNGIKMGGNGSGGSSEGIHEAWRCVVFGCNKTGSVKGFDQNSHGGGVKLVNCLAFNNGKDFMFEKSSTNCEYYNNVCFGEIEIAGGARDDCNAMLKKTDEAWHNNVVTGFSMDDYVSLTEQDAMAPRGVDGSLPTRFARLKKGSVLLDKGLDLKSDMQQDYPFTWQPINGEGRDLGPYEYEQVSPSGVQMLLGQSRELSLSLRQGHVSFSVPVDGRVVLEALSLEGQRVVTICNMLATAGATYTLPLPSSLRQRVFILRLSQGGQTRIVKMQR